MTTDSEKGTRNHGRAARSVGDRVSTLGGIRLQLGNQGVARGMVPKAITVIIPARNEEALITRTVEAALASARRLAGGPGAHLDETGVEIIVIDNASTDRTSAVLAPLVADAGVRIVGCGEPKAACARNLGAELAQGRVLVFVDADTLMPPEALSRIASLCDDQGYEGGFTGLSSLEGGVRAQLCWAFWEHVLRLRARAPAVRAHRPLARRRRAVLGRGARSGCLAALHAGKSVQGERRRCLLQVWVARSSQAPRPLHSGCTSAAHRLHDLCRRRSSQRSDRSCLAQKSWHAPCSYDVHG